jgi:hypothetical protein
MVFPLAVASGSTVNVSGGSIAGGFVAAGDSVVNIRGGSVGPAFDAYGVVNIAGGTVGHEFRALSGSTVNISGGTIGDRFRVDRGATANILGGSLDRFYVFEVPSGQRLAKRRDSVTDSRTWACTINLVLRQNS